ncbi:MAG: YihY/virulence factor BrkB family protein [Rhodospirillaceae bacterium]
MSSADAAAAKHHPTRSPVQVLREDWRKILRSLWRELKEDNLSLVSAGVGFYALLAIFPAIGAIVALYGLIADRATIVEHLSFIRSVLPRDAYQLLADQVRELTSGEPAELGLGFAVGVIISMWSASRAVIALITAMNIAYEEQEERGFIHLNLIAVGFTLAGLAVMLVAMAVLGGLPAVVEQMELPAWLAASVLLLRWPPLGVLVLMGLALLYRYGPSRANAKLEWLSPGAIFAMLLWLLASAGFSLYVTNFGKYNETFGSLAAGIILLLWFYVSAYAVCIGAEINAEIEYRTRGDTTTGRPRPIGRRGATVADTKSPDAE